jgi:CubicO group peptidase (beta-lactamase class C family)
MVKMTSKWSTLFLSIYCVLGFCSLRGSPVRSLGLNPLSDRELSRALDAYLGQLESYGFAGTVLVARKGEILLNKGYGLADKRKGIPCTADTVFDLGSITKQFTAAAILKLEAEGKLSVGDPITRYFEDVPQDKKGITLHHLLTHTAGLLHGYGADYEPAMRDETMKLILDTPLIFRPGEEWSYSNGGFSMLGAIIEKLTGLGYEEYLRESFFKPLGMNSTGYKIPAWKDEDVVKYQNEELDIEYESPLQKPGPFWHLFSNGGILSTTADLYKWHLALKEDSMLNEAEKKKMFTPQFKTTRGKDIYYGYGWLISKTDSGTTLIGHGGGSGEGVNCKVHRYVDDDVVMIVLSHVPIDGLGGAYDIAVPNLEKIIFGGKPVALPEHSQMDSETLEQYTGEYAAGSGALFRLEVENGRLKATARNWGAVWFLTYSGDANVYDLPSRSRCYFQPLSQRELVSFNFRTSMPRSLVFNVGKDGKVEGFALRQGRREMTARKIG